MLPRNVFALETNHKNRDKDIFCKASVSSDFFKKRLWDLEEDQRKMQSKLLLYMAHARFPNRQTGHRSQQRKEVGNKIRKRQVPLW